MLYREIIAVCSQIHTKHINTLCGQNVELLNVKLAVRIVTVVLKQPQQRNIQLMCTECICLRNVSQRHYLTPNIQFCGAKSPTTTGLLMTCDSHCLSMQFLNTRLIIRRLQHGDPLLPAAFFHTDNSKISPRLCHDVLPSALDAAACSASGADRVCGISTE
jgi:hypothetical protein